MDTNRVPIVLYDGACGFCNRSVAFVLKRDNTKTIHFAKIQSEFTKNLFAEQGWEQPNLSTFYLIEKGVLWKKSNAALRVTTYFKAPYSMLLVFKIIPVFLRDFAYDFIAKRRRKFSKGFCVVPTVSERKRFVD